MRSSNIFTILGIFPIVVSSNYDGWTMWYNTDRPYAVGDLELYDKIKQAYYVCGSKKPTKAQCRVVGTHDQFTHDDPAIAPDYLYQPCTSSGIVCRNQDQTSSLKCHDYEIQFFCPQYDDIDNLNQENVTNFWMIALVGAGCIIAPLMCVVVLQCYREVKVRRLARQRVRNRQILVGQQENESSTTTESETAQPPPSYQTLFGSDSSGISNQSSENLISSNRPSRIRSSISRLFRLSNTQVTSQTGTSEQNNDSSVSHISHGSIYHSDLQSQTHDLNSNERPTVHTNRTRRFPGMHISIFDSFSAPCEDIVTPPPTYKDAIIIIGECPPKYSETVEDKNS